MLTQALAQELASLRHIPSSATTTLHPVEESLADAIRRQTDEGRHILGMPPIDEVKKVDKQAISSQNSEIQGIQIGEIGEHPSRAKLPSVASPQPVILPQQQPLRQEKLLAGLDPKKLYRLDELPNETIKDFPTLHYNAHLYSPDLPEARMFMANDQSYSEQDRIDNNTQVEQIVAEGVIFQFKGLRVKINVVDQLH